MKRKICLVSFIMVVLLNVYDTYSTTILLTSGEGFFEANPIMNFAMEKLGIIPALVIIKGVFILWLFSFLLRANTDRMWNILVVSLPIITCYYAVIMYTMNYQSMIYLGGLT